MKIIVCIKQIPDTSDVKWSKDNNLIRDGIISVINPCDLLAISSVRNIENACITYLSMGPLNSEKSLSYALAMGGNSAYLLSDKKFGGADTLATAKTLSYAIKKYINDFDLIVTGQFAQDGDTGQTPYSLANLLGIEHIGYVTKINAVNGNSIELTSTKDDSIYQIRGHFPLMISISDFKGGIYKPRVDDYMRAQDIKIKILDANDININPDETGIKGSPTTVMKAFRPQNNRSCKFISSDKLQKEII